MYFEQDNGTLEISNYFIICIRLSPWSVRVQLKRSSYAAYSMQQSVASRGRRQRGMPLSLLARGCLHSRAREGKIRRAAHPSRRRRTGRRRVNDRPKWQRTFRRFLNVDVALTRRQRCESLCSVVCSVRGQAADNYGVRCWDGWSIPGESAVIVIVNLVLPASGPVVVKDIF